MELVVILTSLDVFHFHCCETKICWCYFIWLLWGTCLSYDILWWLKSNSWFKFLNVSQTKCHVCYNPHIAVPRSVQTYHSMKIPPSACGFIKITCENYRMDRKAPAYWCSYLFKQLHYRSFMQHTSWCLLLSLYSKWSVQFTRQKICQNQQKASLQTMIP